MWLSDISIRRPVFAVMIIAALISLGWLSLGRLGVDLFPKVEFPFVSVVTTLEGAGPEAVETEVSDPLEENINTISGIENLRSESTEGRSLVTVEFGLNENVDVKAQDVRDKVGVARGDLPVDADPPVVQKVDPDAQPILSIMLAGDLPVRDLTRYAEDVVKERVQRVSGVGSVTVLGGRDREVRIWLDADRMRSYGVTAEDVMEAIRREHAEVPGGRLDTGGGRAEFGVKTKGEVADVSGFGDIVITLRNDSPIRVRDVARIEDGMEDERSYAELDGQPGVSLEVRRQSGENTVQVAKAVRAEVDALRADAPEGVRVIVTQDVSIFIEESANDVFGDITVGVILVVIVTLAFLLSWRATAIVALVMPTAIISTFFAFYLADFTINLMTLMALSLSVGLLVDDAIVVLESIHRKLEEGLPPMEAASKGVGQVGLAVLSGTLSIVAVFIPIAFMDGMVGRFFFQYGLAIVFAVSVSLLVALTFTPMMCSRFLTKDSDLGALGRLVDKGYRGLESAYGVLLRGALSMRWLVVLIAIGAVYLGGWVAGTIPMAFSAKADRAEFLATLELPYGAGIETTKQTAARVSKALREVEHVKTVFATVGGGDGEEKVNEVTFYIGLTPKETRLGTFELIMGKAREAIAAAAPEARAYAVTEVPWVQGAGAEFQLQYAVKGPDLQVIRTKTEEIMSGMRGSGLFADVRSTYEEGKPEVQVFIDRTRAADLGVPVRSLANVVRATIGGVDVASFEEFGERYDVRLRLEAYQRDDLASLQSLQVRARDGRLVDLPNVASVEVNTGPAQIDRLNRVRTISIQANTGPNVPLGPATDELERIIASIGLPDGYEVQVSGEAERMAETGQAIALAFLIAIIALYMILASQFNSFTQPIIIMLTAPLSFVGAFIALKASGLPMTMFAQIGMLALMGLVMKNGILIVDYANYARTAQAATAREAMLKAGPIRLRPVLMTAISTICGMIPVVTSVSQGAEFRTPMGVLVIGGLASATLLTLVVVPVAYTLLDDAGKLLSKLVRLLKKPFARDKAAAPAE